MIDRLKAWLSDGEGELSESEELKLAVAALLVEAAQIDDRLDERERATARLLLERRFGLSPEAAQALESEAERRAGRATQLFGFTRAVNQRLTPERRVELIEMLWEIAYADGEIDPLEDALLRQVAGLVDVSDHERGEARRRVLARRGRAGNA